MNGWHDIGGMQCFGRVPRSEDEGDAFHAEWERRVFGISIALPARGVYNLNEFRRARELLPAEVLLFGPYFARWLGAIEALLEEKGVTSRAEITASAEREPVGRLSAGGTAGKGAADVEELAALIKEGSPSSRPAQGPARFEPGEAVRAKNSHSYGHTRLPRYARGRRGVVVAHRGSMVLPDASSEGKDVAEHLYTVRFAARELWGEEACAADSVCLDLWESYLEKEGA